MKTTFVYNYWNNLGDFTFDGYEVKYKENGYDVPTALLNSSEFRVFFNALNSKQGLRIDGFKVTSSNFVELLVDAKVEERGADLFAQIDYAKEMSELNSELGKKWA